jgi:hypothetical protein
MSAGFGDVFMLGIKRKDKGMKIVDDQIYYGKCEHGPHGIKQDFAATPPLVQISDYVTYPR